MREGTAIVGTVIEVQDIRARKQAEHALRDSEERYRFLAESMPQMVWTARPDGALDYVSGQAVAYFGVHGQELLGSGWLAAVHPDDQPHVVERWNASLRSGSPYETEFRLRRGSDGEWRWFLVRAVSMTDREDRVLRWVGTCTDIHDQKQGEAALRRANSELEEFAYVASHDLHEPLRMVNVYSQLVLRELQPHLTDKTRQHATYVQSGVSRMEMLLKDLLAFSRSVHEDHEDTDAPQVADLRDAFLQAVSTLQTRIDEESASVSADPLPLVRGDVTQFTQVFQNLLSNALKYRKQDEPPRVRVSAHHEDSEWIVMVEDNGIGFPQVYADRIFGLFKRLHKNEYPGTGLGLAICKRTVERFGGRIWAESQPGRGSRFFLALPDVEEHARTENRPSQIR